MVNIDKPESNISNATKERSALLIQLVERETLVNLISLTHIKNKHKHNYSERKTLEKSYYIQKMMQVV
ncbi:hypothetical protein QVD17_20816 [Tagetes erecta]|uniref:Uncharacterized protein n=1 Tax=Tagetes erecta TaxID=13708 RepID=A0AAD8NYF3_TARER|nr:hypothetical protein QVD17_20816 [Tagetes erecta]